MLCSSINLHKKATVRCHVYRLKDKQLQVELCIYDTMKCTFDTFVYSKGTFVSVISAKLNSIKTQAINNVKIVNAQQANNIENYDCICMY